MLQKTMLGVQIYFLSLLLSPMLRMFLVLLLGSIVSATSPTILGSCPTAGPGNVFPVEASDLACVADSVTLCNSTCTTFCEPPVCNTVCPTGTSCDVIPWCGLECDTGGDFASACPTCALSCCALNYIDCGSCNITCEAPNCFYNCVPSPACVSAAAGETLTCTAPTCSVPGLASTLTVPVIALLALFVMLM